MRVYVRHLRAAKLCTRGGRAWSARHGISWTDFLRDGIEADRLRAVGDALAMRVIAEAEKEQAGGK